MDYSSKLEIDFPIDHKSCSKCAGNMEEGFVADFTEGQSDWSAHQSLWVKGDIKKNWIGMSKLKAQKKYKISTFRCINCGYLESFALEQVT